MPSFDEAILTNKGLIAAVLAAALAAALIAVPVILRFAFGPRLRPPRNARSRQPRLGIVDVFDLDHKRRLVMVRRDNVEHLLLIGGPTDLVVEAQIVRAERGDLRLIREARSRDKEPREKDSRESSAPAAGPDWPDLAESPPLGAGEPLMPVQRRGAVRQGPAAGRMGEQRGQDLAKTAAGPAPNPATAALAPSSVRAPDLAEANKAGHRPLLALTHPASRQAAATETKQAPAQPSPPAFLQSQRLRDVAAAKPDRPPLVRTPPVAAGACAPLAEQAANATRQQEESSPAEKALAAGEAGAAALSAAVRPLLPAANPAQAHTDTIEEEMARLLGRG